MNNRELAELREARREIRDAIEDAQTMWTFIARHPTHDAGRWQFGGPIYETRAQARAAAIEAWGEGGVVAWRLMSIPGRDA